MFEKVSILKIKVKWHGKNQWIEISLFLKESEKIASNPSQGETSYRRIDSYFIVIFSFCNIGPVFFFLCFKV
jgi:hypothetical protein